MIDPWNRARGEFLYTIRNGKTRDQQKKSRFDTDIRRRWIVIENIRTSSWKTKDGREQTKIQRTKSRSTLYSLLLRFDRFSIVVRISCWSAWTVQSAQILRGVAWDIKRVTRTTEILERQSWLMRGKRIFMRCGGIHVRHWPIGVRVEGRRGGIEGPISIGVVLERSQHARGSRRMRHYVLGSDLHCPKTLLTSHGRQRKELLLYHWLYGCGNRVCWKRNTP